MSLEKEKFPKYRMPKQKWIMYEYEPPYKVKSLLRLGKERYQFNLTTTYSFTSDIPMDAPYKYYPVDPKPPFQDYAQNKTELVAWMVSICRSQSDREKYVKELSKHIPVHIYGECGDRECGGQDNEARKPCEAHLLNNVYKFYLSFENSLCRDYVTEKLWKINQFNIIPVVMGAVDYSNILPAGTFVDARDYPNPKDLANRLRYLDAHPEEYNYMLNLRKAHKRVVRGWLPHECRMCKYLHDNFDRTEIVHDVVRFWSIDTQCISQREYFDSKNVNALKRYYR
jgi:hypothetical protein